MTLPEVTSRITQCFARMNDVYLGTVFDEWAVVGLLDRTGKVLHYEGPRKAEFVENFSRDVGLMRQELKNPDHGYGDFVFERHGSGTHFDAFVVLGEGIYLICNNIKESMQTLTSNPHWLSAQKVFVELTDAVRSNPVNNPM